MGRCRRMNSPGPAIKRQRRGRTFLWPARSASSASAPAEIRYPPGCIDDGGHPAIDHAAIPACRGISAARRPGHQRSTRSSAEDDAHEPARTASPARARAHRPAGLRDRFLVPPPFAAPARCAARRSTRAAGRHERPRATRWCACSTTTAAPSGPGIRTSSRSCCARGMRAMLKTRIFDARMLHRAAPEEDLVLHAVPGRGGDRAPRTALALADGDMCFPTYRQQGLLIARDDTRWST